MIGAWGVLSKFAWFNDKQSLFAKKMLALEGTLQLLRAQYLMTQDGWAGRVGSAATAGAAGAGAGRRVDCLTGCEIPYPQSLNFWKKLLKKLDNNSDMNVTADFFEGALRKAMLFALMESAQLQSIIQIQHKLDTDPHAMQGPHHRAAMDALRRWRWVLDISKESAEADAAAAGAATPSGAAAAAPRVRFRAPHPIETRLRAAAAAPDA